MSRYHQFIFNARCCALDLAQRNWRKLQFHFRGLVRAVA
jgi:hypothetical protein